MSDIIIKTTNLKVYDAVFTMAEAYGKEKEYAEYLWNKLLSSQELMDEFIYYLEHGALLDKMKVEGYTLTDIYVYQITNYNLFISDIGKNSKSCNKDFVVMDTFYLMGKMLDEPEDVISRMNEGKGMDKGFV